MEWIIYPGATHAFDDSQKAARPVNSRGYHGETVMMIYNGKVTNQAWKDSFAFLAPNLKS